MRRIARWRMWLASVVLGQRPRAASYQTTSRGPGPSRPFVRQPWMSPPDDELGVAVAMQHRIAVTPEVAILLTDCVAYSTGFSIGFGLRRRHDPEPVRFARPARAYEPPEMSLEIGIRFADGRQSSRSGHGPPAEFAVYMKALSEGTEPPPPSGPIIGGGSGGGGGRRWDYRYWVWPLPPDGPVTVTSRWPAGGVPDGSVEIDGTMIRRAGASSVKLWPGL